MLIDLLSTDNLVNFNIKVADKLGLHTAIYVSEVLNIKEKAIRKNKLEDGYFTLSRKYLTSRTTLSVKEQKEIESILTSLAIIRVKDEDKIDLDVQMLAGVLTDEEISKDVSKIIKSKSSKRSKKECIIDALKDSIKTSNNELRDAYNIWIDSVFAKQGWMSKASVQSAESVVDSFSNHNLDVALRVVQIAAINGYRDMSWAVNSYNNDNPKKQYAIPKSQTKSNNTILLSGDEY